MKRLIKTLKEFNKNNKGVTLVELIVAVIVLSISIGPLLYTFVFSTRFNANSKVKQRSTSAAQTIMETLKSTDIEEVYTMFNGKDITNPDGTPGKEFTTHFVKNGVDAGTTYKFTSAGTGEKAEGTYEILGMTLSDITSKELGRYDAVITITAGVTNPDMPEVAVFDPRQDALWTESDETYGAEHYDPYYVATELVRKKVSDVGKDVADVSKIDITRNMYLVMGDDSAYVQYQYVYSILMKDGTYAAYNQNFNERSMRPILAADYDSTNFDLRNVYFYYYPAYVDTYEMKADGVGGVISSTNVNVKGDYLYVTNDCSNTVNLFVYKQLNSAKTYFQLATSESTYKLNVIPASAGGYTKVYDCVQASLSDISASNYGTHKDSMLQAVVGYAGYDKLSLESSVGPVSSNVMSYNVNIKIYQQGDRSKVLSEMNGTILNN